MKILLYISFLFLIYNCSLNPNSKYWTSKKNILKDKDSKIKYVTTKEKILNKEFNVGLKIKIENIDLIDNKNDNLNNNFVSSYDGKLKNLSRYKFSKIKKFDEYSPEILFEKKNIIFFDNKGSIVKFDDNSKLLWKKNYYTKSEKNNNPILFFSKHTKYLVIADTLAKFYLINIDNGELIWSKYNSSPFNSQIKVINDNFYVVDSQNILYCFSIKNGEKLWSFSTDKPLVKSQKKFSIITGDQNIIFNNSIGDITSIDITDGKLLWQTPTQSSKIYDEAMFLKTSEMILSKDNILFSDNTNNFYSIDSKTGTINWKQKIKSSLRPAVIDNLVFTVTDEGYFVIIDNNNGNIIRSTYILKNIKKKKRKKIKFTGFATGKNNIYLSTSNGRLFIVNIYTGMTDEILKIDNEKIQRPTIYDKNLYIMKNNSIIKLN